MEDDVTNRFIIAYKSKLKSVTEFSKILGVPQTTLNSQINGTRSVSLEVVAALLRAYPDISSDWLLRGVGEMIATAPSLVRSADDEIKIQKLTMDVERLERENAILSDRVEWLNQYNRELILEIGDTRRPAKKVIS